MTIDELQVLITANTDSIRSEMKKVQGDIQGLQTKANKSGSSMFSSFLKANVVTGLLSKGIQMISGSLDGAVSRVDILNNFTNVMSNLGVGSEDAEASINRLSDKLTGLPTTLDSAAASVQQFTSANGNVKASTEMFLALNNAVLAGGMSAQVQQSALEQLSQAYAKGKPDMMEWRSLQQAMPGQLKQVAQAMGYVSADQLGEQLRNGKVSMNDFMKTIVELNHEGVNGFQSFEEQAFNSTGGIGTSITNMKTAFTRGIAEIINAIGRSNIASFFQGIARVINAVIPYIAGFVKACVWAVNSVASLFGMKTKKNVDSVKKSVANLGSTAGGTTAGGLDKATGSAKKLKKELNGLASFDEMNVLNEANNDDSGSGGGSGGGSTGIGDMDLSGFDTGLDNTKSKADEIAEYLKGVFKGVGNVLKDIWNSEPVQAYVKLLEAQFNFVKDLAIRLGTDLFNNMSMTWTNIQDNVFTILTNISTLFTNIWTDVAEGINTWGPQIIDGISGVFNSIWQDAIDPYLQIITHIWADFTGMLVEKWNEYGKPLVDNIGEFCVKTIELFQKIWDDVLEPIVTPFLETLSWLWDEHLKSMIDNVIDFVGKLVNGALEIYNKFIQPIVSYLLDTLSPAWSMLSNLVIGVLGSILAVIYDTVGGIFQTLGGLVDYITGVFTGNWSKAWNGIKDIFGGVFNALIGLAKFPINVIIDAINSFIAGLNHIKVPDWVPGVGGKGINIPKIPKLAEGGVVDKPTSAIIGEAGKEAVIPLERNTSWMDDLAEKINTGNNDSPQHITINVGDDTLIDKVIDGTNKKLFETNGEVTFNL